MRILIYGVNFPPEQIGIGKYTGEMSAWLAQQGHQLRVVTAPPHYPNWRTPPEYAAKAYHREQWQGISVWRCPIHAPGTMTGKNRILFQLSFACSSFPVILKQVFWRPNIVCVVVPSLVCAPLAWLIARLSLARAWLHIQDFEVDVAFGTGLLHSSSLRRLAFWLERKLLRRFDRVSTISPNMVARLAEKGVDKARTVLFPNWVDTRQIRPLNAVSPYRLELGFADNTIVALYSGTLGKKQGLETLLEAARQLKAESRLRFVICGEGHSRQRFMEEYAGLDNVTWLPLQPFERLNDLLNLADIQLLPQSADVADLVMPSKLTGMLASGVPVIATAAPGTQVYKVVSQCGISVAPGDVEALRTAIERLSRDPVERQRLGAAARDYALKHMDSLRIFQDFERALSALQNSATR